ncbi:MAG: sulfatase-like hydrolase/transferase [Verrucomicrobia bacterium]|nr:sulfatase-like hydrolase/transferase [Verrucomicrobiota bacterium]MCH8526959.1 sulfatase-like hydrolase/transferase [Kiritimatiellia bacterium]
MHKTNAHIPGFSRVNTASGADDEETFDVFHGFHHAREMHSWAENDTVVEHIPLDQVIARTTRESIRFIEEASQKDQPFFLYVPLGSPHTPVVPSEKWHGKSGVTPYADYMMETDDAAVKILDTLDRLNLTEDTLIFYTADNGFSPQANLTDLLEKGHDPSYTLRGYKADAWDGGHRVPCVARWPGVIEPGRVSEDVICHNSLMATCAEILGVTLPEDAGVDSFSILPVLRGDLNAEPTHPYVIHQSIKGHLAIRRGDGKFLNCEGSGGWSKGSDGKPTQLYHMAEDRKESRNLVDENPGLAAELAELLQTAMDNGRSTPGPKMANDPFMHDRPEAEA